MYANTAVSTSVTNFYSRPCGRGDTALSGGTDVCFCISTHAPAGGATRDKVAERMTNAISTHAPAGGATQGRSDTQPVRAYFYSRPCGRGDTSTCARRSRCTFLLTPLREGRPCLWLLPCKCLPVISTHAPAGGATIPTAQRLSVPAYFYSRPCGRGDVEAPIIGHMNAIFLLTPLREGRPKTDSPMNRRLLISTHAPAGGATAIFHKSVMRFCGKLPKDDTVLCLASFGFPRRDPKAVYLAWISCANLPQKCVRQGLALKDQGTSCFHEGLASHAFDPVLV